MRSRELAEQLLDILYPLSCLRCGEGQACVLCENCTFFMASEASRAVLGGASRIRGAAFDGFRYGGRYGGVLKELVLGLKSSQRYCARPLVRLMTAAAGNDPRFVAASAVYYVPSERKKVKKRGYNPAGVLARGVSEYLGIPIDHGLKKTRATLDQGGMGASSRWENVRGAFWAAPVRRRGTVLLVDDVMTTGATADSCSRALAASGAVSIQVLVAARAAPGADEAVFPSSPRDRAREILPQRKQPSPPGTPAKGEKP